MELYTLEKLEDVLIRSRSDADLQSGSSMWISERKMLRVNFSCQVKGPQSLISTSQIPKALKTENFPEFYTDFFGCKI